MKKLFLVHSFLLFSLILESSSSAQNLDLNQIPVSETPSHYALNKWSDKKGYASMPLNLNSVKKVNLNCESKKLYPTHPQQSTKQYHIYKVASYKHFRLNPQDDACTIVSKFKNGSGKYYCQKSSLVESAVISDVYRDECSNLYRAFWRVTFLTSNDNMGTLFSKGRTMYPKPDSIFFGDMILGATYSVDESDFLFLSEVFDTDRLQVQKLTEPTQIGNLEPSENGLIFREKGLIFLDES